MTAPEDPFSPTSDPAAYVPRPATERALAALEEGYRAGQRLQVLSGPPGHGKTLLARVLAERLGEAFRPLYLPYATLPPEEFAAWTLGLLGERPEAGWAGLRALATGSAARPLLLLVDEANSMPEETAQGLDELLVAAEGGLRLLLVPAEAPPPTAVLRRLVSGAMELRLNAPLSAPETRHYVETRLARVGVPGAVRAAFDDEMIERLQRAAEGIPSEIQRLGGEILRGNHAAIPELADDVAEPSDTGVDDLFAAESGAPAATEPAVRPPAPEPTPEPAAAEPRLPGAGEPPFAPPEADPPGVLWIVGVNLTIAAAMFGLLWWLGYIPPPH